MCTYRCKAHILYCRVKDKTVICCFDKITLKASTDFVKYILLNYNEVKYFEENKRILKNSMIRSVKQNQTPIYRINKVYCHDLLDKQLNFVNKQSQLR